MTSTHGDVMERPTTAMANGEAADDGGRGALLALLRHLDATGYRFVTATPGTHARVVARADRRRATNVRDALGWSLPFSPDAVGGELFDLLRAADVLEDAGDGLFRATVRVSSVRGTLLLHSAYPTLAEDSVFLGPDSYRFADLIAARMGDLQRGARILDYAAGSGVGGITAARAAPDATLTLADVNPKALRLAGVNAEFAGLDHREVEATTPADLDGPFDLIVTHPPFMMDEAGRKYRDGGDLYGARLSLDWVLQGVELLREGGKLILHTGVSIVDGRDVLLERLGSDLDPARFEFGYHELDPDIFGDELDKPPYAEVERIAAVGLWVTRLPDRA
jgi:hypothetical protein